MKGDHGAWPRERVRLPAPGRHLDQRPRPVLRQRPLQVQHRPELRRPEPFLRHRRQDPKTGAEIGRADDVPGRSWAVGCDQAQAGTLRGRARQLPGHPLPERGRLMEREDMLRLRGSESRRLVNRASTPVLWSKKETRRSLRLKLRGLNACDWRRQCGADRHVANISSEVK
jgi:hypothetical protein